MVKKYYDVLLVVLDYFKLMMEILCICCFYNFVRYVCKNK